MGYDNWKCTDPAREDGEYWVNACEDYENSPQYATDLEQWLKEASEEEPDEILTEDDYRSSRRYENIIEYRMNPDY